PHAISAAASSWRTWMKRTWSRRLRSASMIPLMPSPGRPKTTSTPQSWRVSINTSAAVSAMRAPFRKSRAVRRVRAESARKAQKTRGRGASGRGARAPEARAAVNDLHGKNAPRRRNRRVKTHCRFAGHGASPALSVVSRAACCWHVRCCPNGVAETAKEENAMKLPAVLAGTTAGLLLAGFAIAQGPATPPREPSTTHAATDAATLGRHTMTGEVTSVTPDKGTTARQDSRRPDALALPQLGAPAREEGRQRDGRARAEGQRSSAEGEITME